MALACQRNHIFYTSGYFDGWAMVWVRKDSQEIIQIGGKCKGDSSLAALEEAMDFNPYIPKVIFTSLKYPFLPKDRLKKRGLGKISKSTLGGKSLIFTNKKDQRIEVVTSTLEEEVESLKYAMEISSEADKVRLITEMYGDNEMRELVSLIIPRIAPKTKDLNSLFSLLRSVGKDAMYDYLNNYPIRDRASLSDGPNIIRDSGADQKRSLLTNTIKDGAGSSEKSPFPNTIRVGNRIIPDLTREQWGKRLFGMYKMNKLEREGGPATLEWALDIMNRTSDPYRLFRTAEKKYGMAEKNYLGIKWEELAGL